MKVTRNIPNKEETKFVNGLLVITMVTKEINEAVTNNKHGKTSIN